MGVLPLQFADGETVESLGLTGEETFSIAGLDGGDAPREVTRRGRTTRSSRRACASTRRRSGDYYRHGGILQFVLRQLVAAN